MYTLYYILYPVLGITSPNREAVYPDAVLSWNSIGVEFRSIVKLSDFKSAVLQVIRPHKREIFGIHDPGGIERVFQLRVGLSTLRFSGHTGQSLSLWWWYGGYHTFSHFVPIFFFWQIPSVFGGDKKFGDDKNLSNFWGDVPW